MNKIKLSICIPTYNRVEKLLKTVKDILQCPSTDFELVILDNKSTDETYDKLIHLKDRRIKIYQNETNIGGFVNLIKVLTLATGDYCLLCLDKDAIIPAHLISFIHFLTENNQVTFGFCELNVIENKPNVFFTDLQAKFKNLSYNSRHPSGLFYKSQNFNEISMVSKILQTNSTFGFNLDLINAECCINGIGAHYCNFLLKTETPEEAKKKKTFSYNINNLYFLPKYRLEEYKQYILHLSSVTIGKEIKKNEYRRLIRNGVYQSTFGYKKIRENLSLCSHYGICCKKISVFVLLAIGIKFFFEILHFIPNLTKREIFLLALNSLKKNNY